MGKNKSKLSKEITLYNLKKINEMDAVRDKTGQTMNFTYSDLMGTYKGKLNSEHKLTPDITNKLKIILEKRIDKLSWEEENFLREFSINS